MRVILSVAVVALLAVGCDKSKDEPTAQAVKSASKSDKAEKPAAAAETKKPAAAAETKNPATAAETKKPAAPAGEAKAAAPAGEAKGAAPAGEAKAAAPAGEAKAAAPAGEAKAATPAGEAKAAAAAKPAAPAGEAKAAAPAGEAKAAGSAKPGPAYFGVAKSGLVRLADGKFTKGDKKPDSFKSIVTAPDGTLFIASYSGVFSLTPKGKLKKIGDFRSPGSVDHLALGPDGSLWGASFKGVSRYSKGAWTVEEKAKLGPEAKLLKGIVVDAKGTVWVASSNAVHVRSGDAWKTLDMSSASKRKVFISGIALSKDGAPYFSHSNGVLKWDAATSAFVEVKLGFRPVSLRDVVFGPDGTMVARTFKELVVMSPGGKVRRLSAKKGDMKATAFESLTIDANGRIWAATDFGVLVYADSKVVEWPQGSVPELSGSVKRIVVIDGGPSLPTVGPVKTGKVSGKILRGGSPVASANVEICKRPSSYFRGTPCKDAPWKGAAKTGADGSFLFDNVPLGTYRFAIGVDGKWSTGWDECCKGMKEGQTFDVGSLKLKEK